MVATPSLIGSEGPVRKNTLWGYFNVFLVIALTLFVFVTSLMSLSERYAFFGVTVYGVVVTVRTCFQIMFARRANAEIRTINRKYIRDVMLELYPDFTEPMNALMARPLRFDDFRAQVQDLIKIEWALTHSPKVQQELADKRWKEVVARSMELVFANNPALTAGLVVPMYKTPLWQLEKLIISIVNQTYLFKHVIIVLNQNDPELFEEIKLKVAEFTQGRPTQFTVAMQPERGKRHAMHLGFKHLIETGVDYIFNADSDSYLDIDALANFLRVAFNTGLGCGTGDVRVWNLLVNVLTILTGHRYSVAFNIERAAQSLFGAVTCMSGPFVGVKRELLIQILDRWVSQKWLGHLCNFGDDRHISTLILSLGRLSLYVGESIVWTDCPESFRVCWCSKRVGREALFVKRSSRFRFCRDCPFGSCSI